MAEFVTDLVTGFSILVGFVSISSSLSLLDDDDEEELLSSSLDELKRMCLGIALIIHDSFFINSKLD